ncbi:MAG: hypothetical protein ACWGNI_00355 [Desulfobacterales bacterium]
MEDLSNDWTDTPGYIAGSGNLGLGPETLFKKKHSLSVYLREKAKEFYDRADDFEVCAELFEKNSTLVNYIYGRIEGELRDH